MLKFANIGKAVLTRALGLQENYKEVVIQTVEVIDEESTGCLSCKWKKLKSVLSPSDSLYKSCVDACSSCDKKCMIPKDMYKTIYRNEANSYGYQPRLKANAIKLFMAYHMYEVDENGILTGVDIRELAKLLGCDVKTIRNNNEVLKKYGYIHFSKTDTYTINLYLPEYENYFKPAAVGGRGFLVVADSVFKELLKIHSLNELRITLRELMEFDLLNKQNVTSVEKSYKELRRLLPQYCKRNVIKKITEKLSMFTTVIKDNLVEFTIKPLFDSKAVRENNFKQCEDELLKFIKDVNLDIELYNTSNTSNFSLADSKYAAFIDTDRTKLRYLFFRTKDIADLVNLCVKYSVSIVVKALSYFYRHYYLPEKEVNSVGALIRTIISKNIFNSDLTIA